jgi:hypothetical protein
MDLRAPSLFCKDVKDLKSAFIIVARQFCISEEEALRLYNLLPQSLQKVPAFHDKLTNLWRYDFGEPIDQLPNNQVVIGAHMFPPIDRLLRVLSVANMRLVESKFANYIQRLSNPAKHQDVLAEISPMFGVDLNISCDFEVSGYGVGNRTIDWVICPSELPLVLFDVKCRMKDLIEGLGRIALGHRGPGGTGPEPVHDVSILFKDTENKFITKNPNEILQGIWIISQLQQERSELHAAFDSLDPMKLHFAILANWNQDAYILIRDGINRELIETLFGIKYSDRFVFDR